MTRLRLCAPNRLLTLPLPVLAALLTLALTGLAPAQATPTILNASQTAHAGDVVFVQGDSFGTNPKVQFSSNGSIWTNAAIVNGSYNQSAITSGTSLINARLLLAGQPQTSLLQLRVYDSNTNTYSTPWSVNVPHVMHYDTPEIAAGSAFRIYGRNLMFNGPTPGVTLTPSVTLTVGGISYTGSTVNTSASTAYVLSVTADPKLPAPLSPSAPNCTVSVSNGLSGKAGTYPNYPTPALTVKGYGAGAKDVWGLGLPWGADFSSTYSNVYDVTAPQYGAKHDGSNDQPAIQSAITDATNAGGGVVYLPPGTYALKSDPTQLSGLAELQIWNNSNVVIAGAVDGQNHVLSTIQYGFPGPNGGFTYGIAFSNFGWPLSKCGLANLNLQNVDTTGQWVDNLWMTSSSALGLSSELFLQRVHLQSQWGSLVPLTNIERLAIENSDFNALGDPIGATALEGGPLTNFVCRNNTFEWSDGQALSIRNMTNSVIEGNTCTRNCDFNAYPVTDNSGGTRTFDNAFLNNVAIVHNTFGVTGGPVPTINDGETILTENVFNPDAFAGTVTGAINGTNPNGTTYGTLTDSLNNFSSINTTNFGPGAVVMIVRGTGTGQWRTITGVSQNTLTLDAPWKVLPTTGTTASHYATFHWSSANETIAGNTLGDTTGKNLPGNHIGIQISGPAARDVLIDGNTLINSGGVTLVPDQSLTTNQGVTQGFFSPIINTQVTNNTITDGNGLAPAIVALTPLQFTSGTTFGTLSLGVEVRGNVLTAHNPNFSSIKQPDANPDYGYGYYGAMWTEGYSAWFNCEKPYPYTIDGTPPLLGTIFQNNTANNMDIGYTVDGGSSLTVIDNPVFTSLPGRTANPNWNYAPTEIFDGDIYNNTVYNSNPGNKSVGTVLSNAWIDSDIGSPPPGSASTLGSSTAGTGVFTVTGGGFDIWGPPDQFNFCYQTAGLNPSQALPAMGTYGTITARITSMQLNPYLSAKVGVMIRGDLSASAAFADMFMTSYYGPSCNFRVAAGSGAGYYQGSGSLPLWVRLVRSGTTITAYTSADSNGQPLAWTKVGQPITISSMTGPVYAGLEVDSNDPNNVLLNTSTFDNVSVTTP